MNVTQEPNRSRKTTTDTSTSVSLTLEKRGDIALIWLDVPGQPLNTLHPRFSAELRVLLNTIREDETVAGVVFCSRKSSNFIAGADIHMLQEARDRMAGQTLAKDAQDIFNELSNMRKPVVAAIHGACLGGGLELALACSGRVASEHPSTQLGLPEVQLGLIPAAGGTQRLPQLIGISTALDLILTGKKVDARKAYKLGLVDEVVAPSILLETAIEHARKRAAGASTNGGKGSAWTRAQDEIDKIKEIALTKNPLGRKILFDQARRQLLKKTHGNYPAPECALDVIEKGLAKGMTEGLAAEAQAFGELLFTPEARSLIHLFLSTTALKKERGVSDPEVKPKTVQKVGILGAGLMGSGIAFSSVHQAGISARIKDVKSDAVARGLGHVSKLLQERVKRRRMNRFEYERTLSRLTGSATYQGMHDVDVIIEAVFEDLTIKHAVLRDVEAVTGPNTIFASNTSAIPITDIAKASSRPENVIGMHYFSPVEKMPLLEIIVTDKTAPWVTATCVELGKAQGKTVIVVKDGVGFYTSRILAPYINEAAHMIAEGVSIDAIDDALTNFGFPVGPITLLDEVGIDVGAKVSSMVYHAFGERMAPVAIMDTLLRDNRLGRKNQRGFYTYNHEGKGKAPDASIYKALSITPDAQVSQRDIAERCAFQMINEALRCLEEGIIDRPMVGDVGAVMGLGFPPFRGGPFRYIDTVGADTVLTRLETFEKRFGPRFSATAILQKMASRGEHFYST